MMLGYVPDVHATSEIAHWGLLARSMMEREGTYLLLHFHNKICIEPKPKSVQSFR